MARIFISYRRGDSAGWTGRLSELLEHNFGAGTIFMDIETIEPGADFVDVIGKAVSSCDVLIAVIGPQWLNVKDANGQRRLDNPDDFIRLEICTALKRNIRVIPVLVGEATMPAADDLPDELKLLARRQCHELTDKRWDYDGEQLLKILEKTVGVKVLKDKQKDAPAKKLSAKALISLVLVVLVLAAYAAEDGLDYNEQIGGLLLSFVALVLGISAIYDAKHDKVKGRILAIVDTVLSTLLLIALFGDLTQPGIDRPLQNVMDEQPNPAVEQTPDPIPPPVMSAPNIAPAEIAPVTPAVPVPGDINISGNWQGSDSFTYVIQQNGNSIQLLGFDSNEQQAVVGQGEIDRQNVIINYRLSDLSMGSAQLHVSADRKEMRGSYSNLTTGLSGALVLRR
jgi:hypothetical protein